MDNISQTRPTFSSDQALSLAAERFGVAVSEASPLPSDRDQNFLLLDSTSGRRLVLKIARSGADPNALDLQNRMMEHLTRAGFPVPTVLLSKQGETVVRLESPDRPSFQARLLSWVPGEQLFRVRPHGPDLLQRFGAFLGGLDRALEDFDHPAQDRDLKWNLLNAAPVIQSHLEHVEDQRRRKLLQRLAKTFLERLGPLVPELRTSVIHGDANDHNVLVDELQPGDDPATRSLAGLVDFGDAGRSYTVGEAAIAGAYIMLGKGDPLTAATHLVTGYHGALPLREAEIAALFPLMGLRLCTSVAISAHQKKQEPNNDYLVVSEKPAWDLLERLDGEILEIPTLMFREACGLEPVPSSGRIIAWLESNGKDASPVVATMPSRPGPRESDEGTAGPKITPLSPANAPTHIFDLRLDSAEFAETPPMEDAEGWTRLLFGKMGSVQAQVGVGRYDEVRRWYTTEAFRAPGGDPPEWRTVHLGIDLFLPAGSPVLAPFDSVVHSVSNNAGMLDYGPTVILEHRPSGEVGESLKFWTLYGHLAEEAVAQLCLGQPIPRGEAFAHIGDFPINGNWAPHLHFQLITDCLGLQGNFPGVALPSQRDLWKALSPDPNLILGIPDRVETSSKKKAWRSHDPGPARPGSPSGAPLSGSFGPTKEEILESRKRHLGPTLSIAYKDPIKIVRGEGQFLYDEEGQPFLDCVNNVPHVGHNHPRVVRAGQNQMALLNTNTRYLHDLLVEYAHRLVSTLPDPLSVVYFVCTGSEANELALRMARTHTGRRDVVVVDGAYHGNTSALVDLSPYKFDRSGGEGAPEWVHKTLMPDPYRGHFRALDVVPEGETPEPATSSDAVSEYLQAEELGPRYAAHIREVLNEIRAQGKEPAAFFCESLLGCGGQIVLPDGYMHQAFEYVREVGGICIADEVQVGFGRVGTHFWAFETQGVIPDIVTLGKPMANGHPMAAVVTTPEIAASFTTGMEYFNTFGGNPVSCAIGMAVLDVIEEEGLQENARVVGEHLLSGLRELKRHHRVIGDARGIGLYLGVELVEDRDTREPAPERAARAKERLRDHRILLSTDGPQDNVLKIKPPLVFTRDDADRLTSTLDGILEEDGIRV